MPKLFGKIRKEIQDIDASERLKLAQNKILHMVNRVSGLILLSEQNSILFYSDTLSGQIPRSYAAHAFNGMRKSLYAYELVQICTFWDKTDPEISFNTIPTVSDLLDSKEVIRLLFADYYISQNDEIGRYLECSRRDNKKKGIFALRRIHRRVKKFVDSRLYLELRNTRDKYLAHSLEATRLEKKMYVAPMKYGVEKRVLEETVNILEALYMWVCGVHFDLNDNRLQQRKYAAALWGGCKFNVVE